MTDHPESQVWNTGMQPSRRDVLRWAAAAGTGLFLARPADLGALVQDDDFDSWKDLKEAKKLVGETHTSTLWVQQGKYSATDYLKKADPGFLDDFLKVYEWVIGYSQDVLKGPVKDFNLVLVDGWRDDLAVTFSGTNTICNDVRKWHELMYAEKSKSKKELLYWCAGHEEYLVQNCQTDKDETLFMLQLSAKLWECAVLLKRAETIGYLWGCIGVNKKAVKAKRLDADADFTKKYDATLTRGLALCIANVLYKNSELAGIEQMARSLLYDRTNDVESFDGIAKDQKLEFNGQPLTIKRALEAYRAYIKREE